MKLLAFSVFDEKAAVFGSPIFCATRGLAVRSFSDAVNQKDSPLYIHASDYKLYLVGEFDTVNGSFTVVTTPEFMYNALDFKEVK